MRNDYRRALILLRSSAPGYSGHVRLERRTLMGSMYFLLQLPSECSSAQAALVGGDRNGYYACALGQLQRDSRGQAVLGYSFDPRDICGRELEKYQLIAVTCGDGGQVVLYGNVNGHAQLDWDQVRTALQKLNGAGGETQGEAPPVGGLSEAPAPSQTEGVILEQNRAADANEAKAIPQQMQAGEAEGKGIAASSGAESLLGIDISQPWPQSIEPLRALFQNSVPMDNPPDEEYVYIKAPMPEQSGFEYCAVGLRVENGVPVSVRYALPAVWTDEPPVGLEDYSWVGDQNRGWWITEVPV